MAAAIGIADHAAGGATSRRCAPRARLRSHGAFHWELAFPEVFFDADGTAEAGRRLRCRARQPALGHGARRHRLVDATREADARHARRRCEFFRRSPAYSLQGSGHANRYQLFLERALQLTKPGGRVGLILPSGIATDHGSAALRKHLLDRTAIDTWLGFDNRRRIFPIHRSIRFVVLSTANGGRTAC